MTAEHSKKVLIVDDEPDICILLSRKLQRKGFQTSYALSLHEGLERFREHKPGYLILDHNLPDGLGLDNLDKFRELDGNVKIIVISAMGHLRERADLAGADMFMSKPLSFKDIEDFIEQ